MSFVGNMGHEHRHGPLAETLVQMLPWLWVTLKSHKFASCPLKRQVYNNVGSNLPLSQLIILMKIGNQFYLVTHKSYFHMLKQMLITINYLGCQLLLCILSLVYYLQNENFHLLKMSD